MQTKDRKTGYEMLTRGSVVDRREFVAHAEECLDKDPARAIDLALERLRIYPDDVEAKIVLGIAWYRKGDTEPALDILRNLSEDLIRWSLLFKPLSELCRARGFDREADRAAQVYRFLNPESPEAIAGLEDRLRSQRRALSETERLDDEPPLAPSADFKTLTLADLYARQGYRELAEALLKEILAADPRNQAALDRLARLRPGSAGETPPSEEPFAPISLFAPPLPDGSGKAAAGPDDGEADARNRRQAVIGTLQSWLAAVDRLKGNA